MQNLLDRELPDLSAHRILIVDDEPELCTLFKYILQNEGGDCRIATSGAEALQYIAAHSFSLVIADVNMPDMNGMDLLSKIMADYHDVAVIMITAVDDREIAVQALEMGAFGYVIKPVTMNELLINVTNALLLRSLCLTCHRQRAELKQLLEQRDHKLIDARWELFATRRKQGFPSRIEFV